MNASREFIEPLPTPDHGLRSERGSRPSSVPEKGGSQVENQTSPTA